MSFRLGMYECPQCGYSEQVAREAPPSQPARTGRVGELRQAWQPDRPLTPPRAEVAPPEARQDLDFDPTASSVGERVTGLELEKRIYFGIWLGLAAIDVLQAAYTAIFGGGGFMWLLSSAFWNAVSLFILAYVLFSGETWVKGCCAVLVVLELLSMAGVALYAIPFLSSAVGVANILPAFIALPFWVAFGIHAVWNGWLLTILWRDYAGS